MGKLIPQGNLLENWDIYFLLAEELTLKVQVPYFIEI